MKQLIAFTMLFPILVFFLLQPVLNYMEETRGKAVEITVQRATEKAAIDGYYTPEILLEMKKKLNSIGYQDTEIEIDATQSVTLRGEYVEATIKVPNKYYFLLFKPLFLSDDDYSKDLYHVRSATRMSEYIN
ncbi:hypothetical protein [Cytobacillus firmus]|mgnify:CR=1 FL=1|uniref:hypothetical protein n=1 Tax=Cytobacillus firmus TaxID=1399 RepID=UPI0018CF115E|nr:hypothetical protein [Cytobacillus firmus]MBG9587682.1 hypothetical protein [Cytobacillus firmus]